MWISPIIPEVREFLISIYKEIVTNYDVDGFHLDYVRYETQNPILYGYSYAARKKFRYKYFNIDPLKIEYLSPEYINWIEFREEYIDTFVRDTSKALKEIKPNIIISAAVAMDPVEARLNYMQDWPHWANNGWVDMIIPMTYMTDNTKFEKNMKTQLDILDNKVFTTIGIGSHMFTKDEWMNTYQIKLARKTSYMGQALFAAKYMTPNLEEMLAETVWSDHASLPFYKDNEKTQAIKTFKDNITSFRYPESLKPYFPKNILDIPVYHITKRTTNIKIDGKVGVNEWEPYENIEIKYDNMGKETTNTTNVKATYDDEALYVYFVCFESNMNDIKGSYRSRRLDFLRRQCRSIYSNDSHCAKIRSFFRKYFKHSF